MTVPNNFTKGVTLTWSASYADYPASLWTLTYTFVAPTNKQEVTAIASGDDYSVTVAMAQTSTFIAGRYDYQAHVSNGTERYLVETGDTCVIEDFAATSGFDARSQLRQTVDAIDAYLLGNATNEQHTRKFNGREIQTHTRTELMQVRSQLKRELKTQERERSRANGGPSGTKIRVVF